MNRHLFHSKLFTFFQRTIFSVLLGLILSLFFILLIFKLSTFQYLVIAYLVGWGLYFVVPLLATLLTTYQPIFAEQATGAKVGLEIGGISVALNVFTGVVILAFVSSHESGSLLPLIESVIFLVFLFFHIIGLMLAALGGGSGSAMKKRWIRSS